MTSAPGRVLVGDPTADAGQRAQSLHLYLSTSSATRRAARTVWRSRAASPEAHSTRLSPGDIDGARQAARAERNAEFGVTAADG